MIWKNITLHFDVAMPEDMEEEVYIQIMMLGFFRSEVADTEDDLQVAD